MVRAGDVPLDRAHAHARWAWRYDAQGDTHRSAAHFGRAMHYAQVAQAFGAPKREADSGEDDLGSIFLGLWEHGTEAWYKLRAEGISAAGLAPATKRRRMQQVLRGHEPQKAAAGQASYVGSAHRVIRGLARCALR